MFSSGSIDENVDRLSKLYTLHHKRLMGTAYNISKNQETAEDLVGDLYLYLGSKVRPKIWFKESFNLFYCINFLQSRFINKVKRDNKIKYNGVSYEHIEETEYDGEFDDKLDQSYEQVLKEIQSLHQTNMWASSKLYELYWITNPDQTLKELSQQIGISNSTSFIHIKRVKEHLKKCIDNPFDKK
jgi:DNA-directed RNA polymerase specialized sigma24 family protein